MVGHASMTSPPDRRRAWLVAAASVWVLCFAAPHVWWALGIPAGFPGGAASYDRFMGSTWRYWYNVAVVAACALALGLLWRLRRPAVARGPGARWARRGVALGSGALVLRGVAGLVVDGPRDLVWWPTFLAGGLLLGSVAWTARGAATRPSDPAPR